MCLSKIAPTLSIGVVVHTNVSILSYSLVPQIACGSSACPKMEEILPPVSARVSLEELSKLHALSSSSANTLAAQLDEEILRAYEIDNWSGHVSKLNKSLVRDRHDAKFCSVPGIIEFAHSVYVSQFKGGRSQHVKPPLGSYGQLPHRTSPSRTFTSPWFGVHRTHIPFRLRQHVRVKNFNSSGSLFAFHLCATCIWRSSSLFGLLDPFALSSAW